MNLQYWILITFYIPFADFITWPLEKKCNKEYDDKKCLLSFYCFDSMDWNSVYYYSFSYLRQNEEHNNFVSNCDIVGGLANFHILYKIPCFNTYVNNEQYRCYRNEHSDECNTFKEHVTVFDMSNQNCNSNPNLTDMNQLNYLNLSHNDITVAKLYSEAHLPFLTNVDYSYNNINYIDVLGEKKFVNVTWLNISHNELEFLPDAIFDEYSKLSSLDLSFNRIEKLQLMTFEGIKDLLYLNVSHNNINNVNSSLMRFKKLKELNLSFNNIKVITTQDFIYLRNLEVLDISFNSILRIEKSSFNSMSLLNSLNLTHNLVESIDKDLFLNNSGLTTIDFSNNNLHSLPKELLKNKLIKYFTIIGNKLKGSLVKGTFFGLTLVSDLDLSNQLLTSISDYAFFGIGALTRIKLNNNNLNFLSKKSFRNLFNLVNLDLSNNKITNIDFEKDDLVSLRYLSLENNFLKQISHDDYIHLNSLNYLNLARNSISKLETNIFKSLQDLTFFEISNNPLSGTIEEGTFDGFNSLPKLDISGTKLTEITNNSFSGMIQLKEFNVSHSSINTLQYNAFANTSQIDTIDLSYNKLSTLTLNSTCLLKLAKLLLNNNMLVAISDNSFIGLYSLTKLDVSHNDIQTISNNALKDQTNLQYLVLSYNYKLYFNVSIIRHNCMLNVLLLSGLNDKIKFSNYSDIPIKSLQLEADGIRNISALNLETLSEVENIDLKHNDISTINVGEFSGVKSLISLDLSHNQIMYIQPGVFEYNTFLVCLNISHNKLKELNYGIFKGLLNLKTLDVSFNVLYDLKNERFYELKNLMKLIVDHNNINSFNPEDFYALESLSIGENPLPCEILINLNKSHVPYEVTAINFAQREENFNGITCNKNKNQRSTLSSEYTQLSENSKVLLEIRDELVRIANENNLQTHSAPANDNESKTNITKLSEKILQQNNEQLIQLKNYSAVMVKETNNTNMLLQKILIFLKTNRKVTTPMPLTKDNATLDNMLTYINKIKQELEDLMTSEKESMMEDINSKLSAMHARIDSSKSITISSTYQPPTQESLKNINTNVQPKSVFTEVCVGLILFILVGYIMYTFYKSKLFIRPRRSSSTRELESPNL